MLTQKTAWVLFVFVYLGIAFGLTRYRLFNLDRWILTAWFWFLCGLGFILIDILLITLTGLAQEVSLMVVLALAGWLYFPLRQITLDRVLAHRMGGDTNAILARLLNEILQRAPSEKPDKLWPDLLQQLYQPLKLEEIEDEFVDTVTVENFGQSVLIPALPECLPLRLYNAQKGARLFSPDDTKLIQSVWRLYEHVLGFQQAQKKGAIKERRRIAADLHDDVSSKILSLVYRADNEENADLARETLNELRFVIHDLESPVQSLDACVTEWKLEIKRRCDESGLRLYWRQKPMPDINLLAIYRACIRKILREVLSNVIKHASATEVTVTVTCMDSQLVINIKDDGAGFDVKTKNDKSDGMGLKNMHRRIKDLNGKLLIESDMDYGTTIEITLPL